MSTPFIGEIRMFGANFAPRDWALCDGQLLTISNYSALFSLLGTFYGGDGLTTFAVPAIWMLGYWFLVQMLGGIGSLGAQGGGVAFWAHVGGFVAGAALIFLFKDARLLARHPYHGWR